MTSYLLCISNAHDEELGGEGERQGELLVVRALLQRLQGLTQRTPADTQRSVCYQHHLQARERTTLFLKAQSAFLAKGC